MCRENMMPVTARTDSTLNPGKAWTTPRNASSLHSSMGGVGDSGGGGSAGGSKGGGSAVFEAFVEDMVAGRFLGHDAFHAWPQVRPWPPL